MTYRYARAEFRKQVLEQQISDAISFVKANPGQQVSVTCGHVRDRARLEEGLREGLTPQEFDQVRIDWAPLLEES